MLGHSTPCSKSASNSLTALMHRVFTLILISAMAPGTPAQNQTSKAVKPLSEAESQTFAREVLAAISAADPDSLERLVDWRQMLCLSFDTSRLTPGQRSFAKTLGSGSARGTGLLGTIAESTRDGGSFRLLRLRLDDEQQSALFRSLPATGMEVLYLEFYLGRDAAGKAIAIDLWTSRTSERMSLTTRRVWGLVMDRPLLKRLFGVGAEVKQLSSYFAAAARPAEQLARFHRLPASLRQNKMVLLQRAYAAQSLTWRHNPTGQSTPASDQEFVDAVKALRKHHPKEFASEMLAISAYEIQGKLPQAIEAIRRLDGILGGDPFLRVKEAELYWLMDRATEAKSRVALALAAEPDLRQGHELLVLVSLREQDHSETLRLLRHLESEFHVPVDSFTELESFRGFASSPQHALLLQARVASLAILLDGPDDERLVDAVSSRLYAKRSNPITLAPAHRYFQLVYHLAGMFDNGGYQFFLETTTQFSETVTALRAVGANSIAAATQRLLDLFPGGTPQSEYDAKMQHLAKLNEKGRGVLNSLPAGLSYAGLRPLLADYVRKHREVFLRLPEGGDPVSPGQQFPGATANTRAVALWCLDLGAKLEVRPIGAKDTGLAFNPADLPATEFTIDSITIPPARRDNTRFLTHLAEWSATRRLPELRIRVEPVYFPDLGVLRQIQGLKTLAIHSDGLTNAGLIEVSALTSLERLIVDSPRINGAGLHSLTRLERLRRLSLNRGAFDARAVKAIEQLPELEALSLRSPSEPVPVFDLPMLRVFEVYGASLDDPTLEFLRDCQQIENLAFTNVPLDRQAWKRISGLPKLQELTLWVEGLDETGLQSLCDHPALRRLNLQSLRVTNTGARFLATIPSFRWMMISSPSPTASAQKILRQAFPKATLEF